MARTRKPKVNKTPEDATGQEVPEPEEVEAGGENRPSQLDQMRAALSDAPAREEPAEEVPELPQPAEEPETGVAAPAHVDEADAESEAAPPPSEESSSSPDVPDAATSAWVPPPAYPPPAPAAALVARATGPSSGLALGLVLVVVGVFFLIMRLFEIDLSTYGWPLYVIIPGLTLLIVGFFSLGTGALVPGGIVTVTGLIL